MSAAPALAIYLKTSFLGSLYLITLVLHGPELSRRLRITSASLMWEATRFCLLFASGHSQASAQAINATVNIESMLGNVEKDM